MVGHHDHRPITGVLQQVGDDGFGRRVVEVGDGFVEQDDRPPAGDGAGDGQASALAAGDAASAGAEPGVEAVGERGVPASEPRSTKGVDERRVVGLGCREGQVGTQGAGEDVHVLGDQADAARAGRRVQVLGEQPVDHDIAVGVAAQPAQEEAPKIKVDFKAGDMVRVTSGPFADFSGVVGEVNMAQSKVKVLVSIFGRETPVELDFSQVTK